MPRLRGWSERNRVGATRRRTNARSVGSCGSSGSAGPRTRRDRRLRRSDLPPRARPSSVARGSRLKTNLIVYNEVGKILISRSSRAIRNAFPRIFPPCAEATMPGSARQLPFPRLAKKILDDYWSFHPSTAAAAGIHRYDGILPVYTAASLGAFTTRVRGYLEALDRHDRSDRLSRHVRLRLGVLRGLLLTELSEIEDQRCRRRFPYIPCSV